MSRTTFDQVVDIIVDVCGIDRAELRPDVNTVDQLGIDSVDFLDIIYEVDRRFGIKVPAERWTEEINSGKATTADYFVLERFVANIDSLAGAAALRTA